MPRYGAVPRSPWMRSHRAHDMHGPQEGTWHLPFLAAGQVPPGHLGRNLPGLCQSFIIPPWGNVLISADQQISPRSALLLGLVVGGFLLLLFPLFSCRMRDVAHVREILHGLQENNKQPRLSRKWVETQPRKMRSEAFSLGLILRPVMLIARLSPTAAGSSQSWELLRNPVLEQCRAYSSPFLPPLNFFFH